MKNSKITKWSIICIFLFTFAIISKAQTTDTKTKTNVDAHSSEIYFSETVHDYGTIKKGADGTCEFTFKNTGDEPLVLSNVKASCGCTIPTWPKDPILPGKSNVIKVVYDTKRVGLINKTITVMSDAKTNPVVLTIKGTVIE